MYPPHFAVVLPNIYSICVPRYVAQLHCVLPQKTVLPIDRPPVVYCHLNKWVLNVADSYTCMCLHCAILALHIHVILGTWSVIVMSLLWQIANSVLLIWEAWYSCNTIRVERSTNTFNTTVVVYTSLRLETIAHICSKPSTCRGVYSHRQWHIHIDSEVVLGLGLVSP